MLHTDLKTHFIAGDWRSGEGSLFSSLDPSTGKIVWQGQEGTKKEIVAAVNAARDAFIIWSGFTVKQRFAYVQKFQEQLIAHSETLALTIALEVAKPLWEARTEVQAMIKKIDIALRAYEERTGVREQKIGQVKSIARHKPHGVIAVFGPFNFPGHLPNGHIVPALLAGNTVIFKPSEQSPAVAEKIMHYWQATDMPAGVINLIQGKASTGEELASADIDGLFFTGSYRVGQTLHAKFAGKPAMMLALEMGGNNPLVVWDVKDVAAIVPLVAESTFITAGQRCTCARRLIIPAGQFGDKFLKMLLEEIAKIRIGRFDEQPEPFMSAVISWQSVEKLLATQQRLIEQGGRSLLSMSSLQEKTGFISPGVMDVTVAKNVMDEEIFGPFLQVIRCENFAEAIAQANNTEFGLAAGLFSDDPHLYEEFYTKIRAGIINWNRPLTGAVSEAPFGGVGKSGNHRPSGYYAADYCAYPVASLIA